MRFVPATALVLLFLGLSTGALRLWDGDGPFILPAGRYLLVAGGLLGIGSLLFSFKRRSFPSTGELVEPRVWAFGLLALAVTDWLCRPYGFLPGPTIRGELLLAGVATWFLLRCSWHAIIPWIPWAAAALLILTFLTFLQGALLISDDHAMFLFRLRLLKENFPSIPFWSPLWNAGIDARDFFATGALNAFILASPLIYLFKVESVYNVIVALLIWGLTPAATYVAARKLDRDRVEAAVAALLVMCTGLTWYRWGLKYGTMGFIVSTALAPLSLALAIRFLRDESPKNLDLALLVCVVSLMLLWSLSGIALAPLALIALPRIASLLRSKRKIVTILALIAINLPWIALFLKVSKVDTFLKSDRVAVMQGQSNPIRTGISDGDSTTPSASPKATPAQELETHKKSTTYRHRKGSFNLRKSLDTWQESAGSLNPLILVLAIPALLSLSGFLKFAYASVITWLILLGTIGVSLKPQLELDRMTVIAAILLCVPVAILIVRSLREAQRGTSHMLSACIVGAFLVLGPFAVSSIVHNRSLDQFSLLNRSAPELSEAIRLNSRGGRAVFTGCVMHELSGGHLAPLALWAETPLVASSYAHNIWRYEQVVPKSYLERGEVGISEFLDHMNASLVVAHEPFWRRELSSKPSRYAEIWSGGGFVLFKRLEFIPSYLLSGKASSVRQNTNSVTLIPESERLVLKFRYFPFLTTDNPNCVISPSVVAPELSLIELQGCPLGKEVTIRSISPIERLKNT